MRRRGFLLGAAAGAYVAGGRASADDVSALPARVAIAPPGSDGGRRLRTRCTGCNLCVAKCPSKVLKAATLEYGLGGTMMPVMDFSRGFCEKDCTVCGDVCPAGAIRRLSKEEKAKEKIGLAALGAGWEAKCLAFKDGHPCALCEKHCRYSAIKLVEDKEHGKGRRPVVDASKCVGCGACVHCCPAHALEMSAVPSRASAAAAETNAVQWVNVGSNSGLFAFDWKSAGVQGLNLASSPQSLRRGVAILKSRRRDIAKGACVVIPICPFSSVLPESYDLKPSAASHRLLPFDGMPDEKAMSGFAGMLDRGWKKEFSIHDYSDPMTETNRRAYSANVARMRDFVGWCRQEGLRPVFVLPPAAKCLRELFPDSFMKAYVYDFIRDVTRGTDVKFLDYWSHGDFQDKRLFATSLFLNTTGRRRFTKRIMDDLL